MEEITGRWNNFSLSRSEARGVPLTSRRTNQGGTIAAKFLTRRRINIEAVARTFRPLWHADKGFTIRDMGENKAIFTFKDIIDVEQVIQNGPWAYDRSLVVCKRVEANIPINEVQFTHSYFWVQIHGLSVLSLNQETSEAIGQTLGMVEHAPESVEDRGGGPCMRVRVLIDITKPLCRGRKILIDDELERWVSFKYEKLPNFCYRCGQVCHGEKDCAIWLANRQTLQQKDQQFGPWMRASMDYGGRRTAVLVNGESTDRSTTEVPAPPNCEKTAREAPVIPSTIYSEAPTPMDEQDIHITPHAPHVLVEPQQRDHDQTHPTQEAQVALFAAELERIDAAIGYNNIVQDQHHTTIEKVAQLTSVLEGSSQNPHPQSILLDNQIAENSNNNISVIQGFDSGLESTRLSREELLDTVEIIPAQAEFNANPTSSSIPRWKQRARKSTSTINQPQNQVEHSGTNKRTREEEEHSESGEKPSTKRRTIQDRDTDTTAGPNESFKPELSWAWEPTDSSRASRVGEARRSRVSVST